MKKKLFRLFILTAISTIALWLILTAISYASSEVGLEWDASPSGDVRAYQLYMSSLPLVMGDEPDPALEYDGVITGTSAVLTVQDGTWYWAVTSIDESDNESVYSNVVTRSLDTERPLPPGNLRFKFIRKILALIWFAIKCVA